MTNHIELQYLRYFARDFVKKRPCLLKKYPLSKILMERRTEMQSSPVVIAKDLLVLESYHRVAVLYLWLR